jgi:hypothetical protein
MYPPSAKHKTACRIRNSPERRTNAIDVSRQVGAEDETASPIADPKANKTNESAEAESAPTITADQLNWSLLALVTVSSLIWRSLTEAEEGQDRHNNYHQADEINQTVHVYLPLNSSKPNGHKCELFPIFYRRPGTHYPAA